MQIYHCMMAGDRLKTTKANLDRVYPFVDKIIFVHNGDDDGTRAYLESLPNVIIVDRLWDDSFVDQRNAYLAKVSEIKNDDLTLICVSDDDEFFSEGLLQTLPLLAKRAWEDDLNTLCVRVRDVTVNRKGERIHEQLGDWYKPLIFLHEPGMHYVGVGNSLVHEHLVMPSGSRSVKIDDKGGTVIYEHIKEHNVIWPRGTRNFFAGGGGMNLGDAQPLWRPFREMLKRVAGVERSPDYLKYLERGNIHPEVKEWFIRYRLEGTNQYGDHEGRKDPYDGSSEIREGFKAYFLWFHPEELPEELIEEDLKRGYMDYRAECRAIWGDDAPRWAKE